MSSVFRHRACRDVVRLVPLREAAGGIEVRLARVVVLDLSGEEFEYALGGFRRRREKPGGNHGRGSDCLRCQAVSVDPAVMTAPPRAAEKG
jgi:hypothetical protein